MNANDRPPLFTALEFSAFSGRRQSPIEPSCYSVFLGSAASLQLRASCTKRRQTVSGELWCLGRALALLRRIGSRMTNGAPFVWGRKQKVSYGLLSALCFVLSGLCFVLSTLCWRPVCGAGLVPKWKSRALVFAAGDCGGQRAESRVEKAESAESRKCAKCREQKAKGERNPKRQLQVHVARASLAWASSWPADRLPLTRIDGRLWEVA